jgi:hypothetical protein
MRAKRGDYYVELVTWLAPCRITLFADTKSDDRFTTAFLIRAATGAYVRILQSYSLSLYPSVTYLLFGSTVI